MLLLLILGAFLVLNLAAFVVAHAGLILVGGGVVLAAAVITRRRHPQPVVEARRGIPGRAESAGSPEVARLRAELEEARRQVAKLEDDAGRHDQLVSDLEDVAGRPIEAVIATYRHMQRQYGPAAVGKPGRRP